MKRLVELRKKANLSQASLSRIFNVGQTTISSWERGEKEPDCATLIRLADYFDTSIDYLLNRTDNPAPIRDLAKSACNTSALKNDLTPSQLDQLNNYIKFLLSDAGG